MRLTIFFPKKLNETQNSGRQIGNVWINVAILFVIFFVSKSLQTNNMEDLCREAVIKCSQVKSNCMKLTANCNKVTEKNSERCLKIKAKCSLFKNKCIKMKDKCLKPIVAECTENCRLGNESTPFCSGRGTCECSGCKCDVMENPNQKIWGEYCECDNFNCPTHNGWMCSGSHCECGICQCQPGRFGLACEMEYKAKETLLEILGENRYCQEFSRGQLCSGHGACIDGRCYCQENFMGRFCEKCLNCRRQQCDKYRPCVYCLLTNQTEGCNCSPPLLIEVVNIVQMDQENDDFYCHFTDSHNCRFYFVIGHDAPHSQSNTYIRVQDKMDCPKTEILHEESSGSTIYWILFGIVIFCLIVAAAVYGGIRYRRSCGVWHVSH